MKDWQKTWLFFVAVKSLYRKQIDEVTKDSRIQKWVFATPEDDIDDPTGEIRRLKKQVNNLNCSRLVADDLVVKPRVLNLN